MLLRAFLATVLLPSMFFSLLSCNPEDDVDSGRDTSSSSVSDVVVTGGVDELGCTFAVVGGYVNFDLLPTGSEPIVGVELEKNVAGNGSNGTLQLMASLFKDGDFMVSLTNLIPATEYKYRSFATYGNTTYYGEYSTFTTKAVINIASTNEANNITHRSAIITSLADTTAWGTKENVYVGVAYAVSRSAICTGGVFGSQKVLSSDVVDSEYVVTLTDLVEGSTYYYAAFTEVGGTYVFSSVKEFETLLFDHKEAEAVDLGLSVQWASWNVGAECPEDYGCYYAWGEIEEKCVYDWSTYKWCNGSDNSMTKYCTNSSYGTVDGKIILEPADDVAHVLWGDDWRMPTVDEIRELLNKCTWKWETINGVNGYRVSGNGCSIFLPAAGRRSGGYTVLSRGEEANYWSASSSSHDVNCISYCLYFSADNNKVQGYYNRRHGEVIRPVKSR